MKSSVDKERIEWRSIPRTELQYSDDFLKSLGAGLLGAVKGFLHKRSKKPWPSPEWEDNFAALISVFNLCKPSHFLSREPIVWTIFHEPQITGGFAHFLETEDPAYKDIRVRAFLRALGVATSEGMSALKVEAEHTTNGNKRIDLLVTWEDEDARKNAAVIEAKFGHLVSHGQLKTYRRHVRWTLKVDADACTFVVAAPRENANIDKELRRNRNWRFISWHILLLRFDKILPIEADSEAFRQFRRTVWHQS